MLWSKMPQRSIVFIVFLSLLKQVLVSTHPDKSKPKVIEQCKVKSTIFTENEDKYGVEVGSNFTQNGTPTMSGRLFLELIVLNYEKEVRQRPFECIAERLHGSSRSKLKFCSKYERLVENCASQQPVPECDPKDPYRTMDATCNNLFNPGWGSARSCLRRLLPAHYEGVSGFRRSVCGGPLPPPRFISLKFHAARNRPSHRVASLLPYFGQLVAHEMTDVPMSSVRNMTINCCASTKKHDLHPQCAPIYISRDDPFYSKYNVTCLNFRRTAPCDTCSLGKRRQINDVTSYIDLSFIYGTNNETSGRLRTYDETGKLIVQHREAGELLQPDLILQFLCGSSERLEYCFLSGDRRVNQQTPLMSLHTLFVREHNRIAEKLKQLNPKWSDEILFQESRKINIAQMQAFVYKELVPELVGRHFMSKYGLRILQKGRTRYNPKVDSTMLTEFNTAAYRLHSTVSSRVGKYPVDVNEQNETKRLKDMFSLATPIYNNQVGRLLKGMCRSPAQGYDRFVVPDMTNFMYRRAVPQGLDIASINIQRGRDNGLPPYIEMVRYLSNGKINIKSFNDLKKRMDPKTVALLKEIYCDVRDIDLWVGMNSERVPTKGFIAPTAAEIIAIQFNKAKYGDRFYFEHKHHFTNEQLRSLRKASLSSLLCENMNITRIQENALVLPSKRNHIRSCSEIPRVNLKLWKKRMHV